MKQPRRGLALPAAVALVVVAWLSGGLAMAAEGLTTISSDFGPKETMDRLEAELKANGVTVFARIDHAAGAASVGLPLRPTELLIFGNAKAGTPLMQANQAIGIDLPLKALAYSDPSWLAGRHGLGATVAPNVAAMAANLEAVTVKATKSP